MRPKPARRRTTARGFSLLEVMIVISIIALILGIVGFNVIRARDRATDDTTKIQLRNLNNGLKAFYLDFDRYPTDEEGVSVLWSRENIDPDQEARWRGPYIDTGAETDQWGNQWGYRAQGENAPEGMYDLYSFGPDGQEGTDDDINFWADQTGAGDDGFNMPPPPR